MNELPEWELWACAHATLKLHGENAAVFVAERIGDLALKGDDAGMATWKAIARCILELQAKPPEGDRH